MEKRNSHTTESTKVKECGCWCHAGFKVCIRCTCHKEVSQEKSAPQEEETWVGEFDAMFWLHRVPKNTKQARDIKAFIASKIAEAREEGFETGCKLAGEAALAGVKQAFADARQAIGGTNIN
jgi:hypothetical protein